MREPKNQNNRIGRSGLLTRWQHRPPDRQIRPLFDPRRFIRVRKDVKKVVKLNNKNGTDFIANLISF